MEVYYNGSIYGGRIYDGSLYGSIGHILPYKLPSL